MQGLMNWTTSLSVTAALLAAAPASAQFKIPDPAPGPDLTNATRAAKAAFDACQGIAISVAILDSSGRIKLLMNGDGSPGLFAEFAQRKAATAVTFNKPSSQVRDEAATDAALAERLKTDPKLIGFGGGLPLAHEGKPWGAVAVAGAPSQETDARCAAAAQTVLLAPTG